MTITRLRLQKQLHGSRSRLRSRGEDFWGKKLARLCNKLAQEKICRKLLQPASQYDRLVQVSCTCVTGLNETAENEQLGRFLLPQSASSFDYLTSDFNYFLTFLSAFHL